MAEIRWFKRVGINIYVGDNGMAVLLSGVLIVGILIGKFIL